jgi:transcriptional regulator with XRE-family HTH domain
MPGGTVPREQPHRTMEATFAEERSTFATLLRRYRLDAGLSQEELAERARLSTVSISALERGTRRAPYRATIASLAEALGLTAGDRARLERSATRSDRTRVLAPERTENADRRNSNLPFALSSFFGRASELAEITALLHTERLVTLTGAGGIGKTRTALQVGAAVAQTQPDGAWFVELAPLVNPALVASTILFALRIQESPDRSTLETLVSFLQNKTLVLILDNCEHVIGQAAIVTEALLRDCPKLRIVATCREPLRLSGERVYRMPSLAIPSSATQAVQLGQRLVGAPWPVWKSFAMTEGRRWVAAARARIDEGTPLSSVAQSEFTEGNIGLACANRARHSPAWNGQRCCIAASATPLQHCAPKR